MNNTDSNIKLSLVSSNNGGLAAGLLAKKAEEDKIRQAKIEAFRKMLATEGNASLPKVETVKVRAPRSAKVSEKGEEKEPVRIKGGDNNGYTVGAQSWNKITDEEKSRLADPNMFRAGVIAGGCPKDGEIAAAIQTAGVGGIIGQQATTMSDVIARRRLALMNLEECESAYLEEENMVNLAKLEDAKESMRIANEAYKAVLGR